jgi:hypothetical protein
LDRGRTTVSKEKGGIKVANSKLHTKKKNHPDKLCKFVMTHDDYLNLLDTDDFPGEISVIVRRNVCLDVILSKKRFSINTRTNFQDMEAGQHRLT